MNTSKSIFIVIGSVFSIVGAVLLCISLFLGRALFAKGILVLLGIIFLVVGCALLFVVIRKGEKEKSLQDYGMVVQGKICAIVVDSSLTINGNHPWKILVQFTDEYENRYETYAKEVWNIDGFQLGDYLDVYYDIKNPNHNYVDIDRIHHES